jgi:hypothetical protein
MRHAQEYLHRFERTKYQVMPGAESCGVKREKCIDYIGEK